MSDDTPEPQASKEKSGFMINVLTTFFMAVLIPARYLYPNDTQLTGFRFAAATIFTAYLWVLLCVGLGSYWHFAGMTTDGWVSGILEAFRISVKWTAIAWLVLMFIIRKPVAENTADEIDPDPQQLLPAPYRSDWIVVPKDALNQVILVGVLLGAGVALTIAGFVMDVRVLEWAFPVALLTAYLQNKLFPWSADRLLGELKRQGLKEPDRDASEVESESP